MYSLYLFYVGRDNIFIYTLFDIVYVIQEVVHREEFEALKKIIEEVSDRTLRIEQKLDGLLQRPDLKRKSSSSSMTSSHMLLSPQKFKSEARGLDLISSSSSSDHTKTNPFNVSTLHGMSIKDAILQWLVIIFVILNYDKCALILPIFYAS